MNYFLFEAQGSAERMSVHNIYALLSAYANKKGRDIKPYDLSRDKDVKKQIKSLELPHNQDDSIIPAYIPLDINSLVRKTSEEITRALIDRENYCKNIYMRTARALEEFKSLNSQVDSLKDTQKALTEKVQDLSSNDEALKVNNLRLKNQNNYLKGYIKKTIEPLLAESLITGIMAPELSKDVKKLPKNGQEPAVVAIKDYFISDCANTGDTVSAKSILTMLNRNE